MNISEGTSALKSEYEFVGDFSPEAKKDFLDFLEELNQKDFNCGVVSHTNHSNHNNW